MKWLIKNIGLAAFGLCLIAMAATIAEPIEHVAKRLSSIEQLSRQNTLCRMQTVELMPRNPQ